MKVHAARAAWLMAMLAAGHCGAAMPADTIIVQCTVDKFRSSFASRLDIFTIQVDLDAKVATTYYGTVPIKLKRKELRGVGRVDDGWHSSLVVDRITGRLAANVDKVEHGKYSFAELQGNCILPPELQGAGYRASR